VQASSRRELESSARHGARTCHCRPERERRPEQRDIAALGAGPGSEHARAGACWFAHRRRHGHGISCTARAVGPAESGARFVLPARIRARSRVVCTLTRGGFLRPGMRCSCATSLSLSEVRQGHGECARCRPAQCAGRACPRRWTNARSRVRLRVALDGQASTPMARRVRSPPAPPSTPPSCSSTSSVRMGARTPLLAEQEPDVNLGTVAETAFLAGPRAAHAAPDGDGRMRHRVVSRWVASYWVIVSMSQACVGAFPCRSRAARSRA
jgi:hypothetical protein